MDKKAWVLHTEEEMARTDSSDPLYTMMEAGQTYEQICEKMGWVIDPK